MIRMNFTDEEIAALNFERYHYPDPRVQKKFEVLWLKSQRLSHETIAQLSGVSSRQVQRYLNEYLEGGIERLKQNLYSGSPSELNHHTETLKDYFTKNPPSTAAQAQKAIEELTGLRRSLTQVREFLKRLGMKRRKVGSAPGKADDPEKQREQREFLDAELKPRLDEAEQGKRKIFFVDASHFVFGAFLCYLWCFVRHYLRTPAGRHRHNVLGALDYVTKQLITVVNTTYINALTVGELLQTLKKLNPDTPITLVMDNARYQRCALVQEKAKELSIELLFLPSYSPNLNLIERVWKFVKAECLGGKHYENFEAFQQGVNDCIHQLSSTHKKKMDTLITRNFQLFENQTFLAA